MSQKFGSFQGTGNTKYLNYNGSVTSGDIWFDHSNAAIKIYNGTSWDELISGLTGIDDNATSTAITIDSNENVGIRTSSPSSYPVASELVVDTGTNGGITVVSDSTAGGYGGVYFADGTAGNEQYRGFIQYNHNNGGSVDDLILGTSGTERMRVDSSGNVGIGTASPDGTFHVKDAIAQVYIQSNDGQPSQVVFGDVSDASGGMIEYTSSNEMAFKTNNLNERMRIDASGNVGIGTASPDAPLTLKPQSGALGTHVNQNWSYDSTSSGAEFDLKLKQLVSSGLVKYAFDLRNGGTSYDNNLVLDRGNVGIGTSSPVRQLSVEKNGTALASFVNTAGGSCQLLFGDSVSDTQGRVLYDNNGDYLALYANGSERMRVDSSGNVGIGTTTTTATRLTATTATANHVGLLVENSNTADSFGMVVKAGNDANDYTADFRKRDNTNIMRIRGDGKVGIGTSSPTHDLTVGSTAASDYVIALRGGVGGFFGWDDSANKTIVQAPNQRSLSFQVNSDTFSGGTEAMRISDVGNVYLNTDNNWFTASGRKILRVHGAGGGSFLVLDTSGSGDFYIESGDTGYVNLWNQANNYTAFGTNNTERMRIDSGGKVFIGKSSSSLSTAGFEFNPLGLQYITRSGGVGLGINRTDSDGDSVAFYRSGNTVGTISVTSSATAYNTSSDVRLKENIVDAPAGNIDAIRVRSFDWKADGSHQTYGVIAQELIDVAPNAVSQGDAEDNMWSVDYSKLVPMMIKEIQDLKAEVAALKGA